MNPSKPIKRSKQLAPFSREHHDALVFLLRIKQGLKNGTAAAMISEYIHWFWTNNLETHFKQEERLLLPHLPEADKLAKQLKDEHESIRALIGGQLDLHAIEQFSNVLNAHIRFEERELFPHIESKVPSDHLNEIFEQLDRPVQCQTSWMSKFWTSKKQ
jgi:hemerythrin-like domain-containing protein